MGTHVTAVVTMFNEKDAVQRKSQNSTMKMKNSLFSNEGCHYCVPKINPDEAITIAQDVQKNRPISMELSKTPQQFQMDLLGYYVAMGQIKKAKEVANICLTKD